MVTPKIFAEDRGDKVWSPNISGKAMVAATSVVWVPGLMKCRSWNFDGSKVEPWVLLHWVQLWYASLRVLWVCGCDGPTAKKLTSSIHPVEVRLSCALISKRSAL